MAIVPGINANGFPRAQLAATRRQLDSGTSKSTPLAAIGLQQTDGTLQTAAVVLRNGQEEETRDNAAIVRALHTKKVMCVTPLCAIRW